MEREGRSSNVILVALLVVFLGVIGFLIYQNYQLRQERQGWNESVEEPVLLTATGVPSPIASATTVLSPTVTMVPSPVPTVDIMSGWSAYSDNDSCYTFKYPKEVVFKMQGDIRHLSLFGPTQKQDTEFFDGISVSFSAPMVINTTLLDYVDSKIEESKQFGEILKPREQIVVNGITGYTYTTEGLGVFKNIYLQSMDKSCTVEITDATVDPTSQGYQEIVDKILTSFKFVK